MREPYQETLIRAIGEGMHGQASASIGKHRQASASIGKHRQARATLGHLRPGMPSARDNGQCVPLSPSEEHPR
ncbi:MAG TPA: hypothetical protein VF120_16645 [Ktedonobacterales bacterium]